MKKRALISVYDKQEIEKIVQFFISNDFEIVSTGGTLKYLKSKQFPVIDISEVTGFEEILDGRVKTLHPKIHGGILAVRNNEKHMEILKNKEINTFDAVIVNLYPFFEKVNEDLSFEEKIEFIDIGGPSMLRSAAKNFNDVIVICDKNDYDIVINEIKESKELSFKTRKYLASKVFNLTSSYDASISNFLLENDFPDYLSLSYVKSQELRYGENPHQKAAFYNNTSKKGSFNNMIQLNGKELSYNNIRDIEAAWNIVNEFQEITCCAVKHNVPCGVASAETVEKAYLRTYECDTESIFGGIVASNSIIDKTTALEMNKIFLEVIIAPDFTEEALEIFRKKKNLRILKFNSKPSDNYEYLSVDGGILVQTKDKIKDEYEVVTTKKPTNSEIEDMLYGMKVVKHVKSNAIVVIKNKQMIGAGGGHTSRINAANQALLKSKNGGVIASDAFIPFDDVVEEAYKHGVTAIIQPGGSKNDEASLKACEKYGISMLFTGIRHFKH